MKRLGRRGGWSSCMNASFFTLVCGWFVRKRGGGGMEQGGGGKREGKGKGKVGKGERGKEKRRGKKKGSRLDV